jgi:hypothetical protein
MFGLPDKRSSTVVWIQVLSEQHVTWIVVFWVMSFRRLLLGKMKALSSSETLVTSYRPTQHYNSEDLNPNFHSYENLKYHNILHFQNHLICMFCST